ncbi:uncharacterized protein [Primulina eburnea]|uniref:uncharacterized protein n=1 Tax=Primulina eburnea TaxID=1245227 RepID=UPI003C6C4A7A
MKKVEQKDVILFVKEHIIHRFGIPQSITTEQGTLFVGSEMKEFAEEYGIQLINSSPHYPQSNGHSEASNQVLIKMLKKMMEDNSRDGHRLQSENLWAYRTSKRSDTGLSPFTLTYGHDVVLPMEVVIHSLRVMKQNELEPELYTEAMIIELEDLDELRMQTYNALVLQKSKVARSYNKRVNKKVFEEGDVVWKVILPLGSKDREIRQMVAQLGRAIQSPSSFRWKCIYWLASLDGEPHRRCINRKYLKHYYPSSWVGVSDINGS